MWKSAARCKWESKSGLRGNEQEEIKHPDEAISIANLISSRGDFFSSFFFPLRRMENFFLHPLRTLRKARKRDKDSSSKHGDFYGESMLLDGGPKDADNAPISVLSRPPPSDCALRRAPIVVRLRFEKKTLFTGKKILLLGGEFEIAILSPCALLSLSHSRAVTYPMSNKWVGGGELREELRDAI
jgi:hypothetical protein